jgi:MATE family multidrug resistance protein
MVFADRWLLAHYSVDAHNAAVTSTTMGWAFIFGWIVLANISEVFVAQYNGAGLSKRLGEPIWQMIWLSIASIAFFWPLSYWGPDLFFGSSYNAQMEREYFRTMTFFGPFYPLYATLCGYFIGQGKTSMVTALVVIANVVNVLCDCVLIFGVEGWLEPMGVNGAAIATSFATLFQAVVLGAVFLSRKNRMEHGTGQWQLRWDRLLECLKIGLPSAIFSVCQLLAFGVYYSLMREMGPEYITIAGICQAMFILCFFFAEGLNKATSTIVGNVIGAGQSHIVYKVIRAGLKLNCMFLVLLLGVFFSMKSIFIREFLPNADPVFVESIRDTLEACLLLMAIQIFFEGIRYQFAAILTASGDTFFMLLIGTSLVWLAMVFPVYYFVMLQEGPMELAFTICIGYSVLGGMIYYWRIRSGRWSQIVISDEMTKARQQM